MKTYIAQRAIILRSDKKFLALQAVGKKYPWELPGGGVSIPESLHDGIQREIREETGLTISVFTPFFVDSRHDKKERCYSIFLCYSSNAHTDTIVISKEHSGYKWVSVRQFLLLNAAPYQHDLVKRYRRMYPEQI